MPDEWDKAAQSTQHPEDEWDRAARVVASSRPAPANAARRAAQLVGPAAMGAVASKPATPATLPRPGAAQRVSSGAHALPKPPSVLDTVSTGVLSMLKGAYKAHPAITSTLVPATPQLFGTPPSPQEVEQRKANAADRAEQDWNRFNPDSDPFASVAHDINRAFNSWYSGIQGKQPPALAEASPVAYEGVQRELAKDHTFSGAIKRGILSFASPGGLAQLALLVKAGKMTGGPTADAGVETAITAPWIGNTVHDALNSIHQGNVGEAIGTLAVNLGPIAFHQVWARGASGAATLRGKLGKRAAAVEAAPPPETVPTPEVPEQVQPAQGDPNATLQSGEVARPVQEAIRLGGGGEAGTGRSRGQGARGKGQVRRAQSPAGAGQAQTSAPPEAQGQTQVPTNVDADAGASILQRRTQPAAPPIQESAPTPAQGEESEKLSAPAAEPRPTDSTPAEANAAATSQTSGVAERVRNVMAEEGRAEPYKSGEGWSPRDAAEYGKRQIDAGVDPEQHLAMMQSRGGGASGHDMAILRAHDDALARAENRAGDALHKNPDSPELKAAYDQAKAAERDWYERISPYRTESSKTFTAQQGETDVDTGSFTSLTRHFERAWQRAPTPEEAKAADAHASRVTDLEKQVAAMQSKLDAALAEGQKRIDATQARRAARPRPTDRTAQPKVTSYSADELAQHFAKRKLDGSLYASKPMGPEAGALRPSKSPPKFTLDEVQAIWNHAKSKYIGMGNVATGKPFGFDEVIDNTARDLGLTSEEVAHAFTQPKSISPQMLDEMYRVMNQRRRATVAAKIWLESGGKPAYQKLLGAIYELPRAVAVFGHGTVGMTTHAGVNIFRPTSWSTYWPSVMKQWHIFFGKPGMSSAAVHEQMARGIETHPSFAAWTRAGLKIDPNRIYDSWQVYARYFGKAGGKFGELAQRGDRGMDVLKKFRLEYAEKEWGRLPEEIRTPEMRKQLANWVNHVSGVGDIDVPGGALGKAVNVAFFAPSKEAAAWARVIGDPIKTAKTLSNWKSATPDEKAIAQLRVKRAAEVTAVMVGVLEANNGLLMATHQKDRVNLTDPTKPDFLQFKWGKKRFDATGSAMSPVRIMAGMSASILHADLAGAGRQAAYYVRGKFNPTFSLGADVALQKDYSGRPYPWASKKVRDTAIKAGKKPVAWAEVAWERAPIPVSGVAREVYDSLHAGGSSERTSRAVATAIEVLPMELAGIRVSPEVKPKETQAHKELMRMFSGNIRAARPGRYSLGE